MKYERKVYKITKHYRAQERLIRQADQDPLTKLPNRTWLVKKIKTIIQKAANQFNYQYALLVIDIDSFKMLNSTLGYTIGDQLLKQVAQRLENLIGEQQSLARLNSDEFVILVENFSNLEQILHLVQNIQAQFNFPFKLNHKRIHIYINIGIALGQTSYKFPKQVIGDANIALHQARSKGKGSYAFFSPTLQAAVLNRLQIENDLHGALERQEFFVCYQPIISHFKTNLLMGFEALIRWQHPKQGLISPDCFIPIIEEMGLIKPIGLWVLRQACQQIKKWILSFPEADHLWVSVNISPHQLQQPDLLEQISLILQEVELESRHLKLEITESTFMRYSGSEISILQGLRDLGIRLCIDDFGTGYSSLSRLQELPIDTLKIDRAFVRNLETSGDMIIKTIITLAHVLNINVIAEGIETLAQFRQLQDMQCEMGQGYLFSRPVEASIATNIVAINLGKATVA